jgi:sarcosine oxidase subunit gamma
MVELLRRRSPAVLETPWLKALPPAARIVLHGGAAARTAALPVWSADFSEEPCRANVHGFRATLWLGPDEFLLLDLRPAAGEPAQGSLPALERALAGIPHALVDVSHRQIALEVRGPHAATILSGACPLDLDAAEFPVGMCTRTALAKADIVLWRTAIDVFHLEVWRSFTGYVTGLLAEIATEFHPPR